MDLREVTMTAQPFVIKPAVRTFQPALIGMWGGSSSGKTYSALRLARGLVGPTGRIGVIDTENRRSLFYAGKVGGPWDHLDFQPQFTPERYIEAFRAFETGGYNCIIIDSASHVWEGEGGVLDQADKNNAPGLAKWAKPKMALKRMVNTLLRSHCHVIFCLRAKMGVVQEGRGREATIKSDGLMPIMEKNLIYEMTVSILLGPNCFPLYTPMGDKFFVNPLIPAVKAPEEIKNAIRPGEYITEATGEAIRNWLGGATRDVVDEARRICDRGSNSFRGWWPTLSATDKTQLAPIIEELKTIAAAADARTEAEEREAEAAEAYREFPDASPPGDDLLSGFGAIPPAEPVVAGHVKGPMDNIARKLNEKAVDDPMAGLPEPPAHPDPVTPPSSGKRPPAAHRATAGDRRNVF